MRCGHWAGCWACRSSSLRGTPSLGPASRCASSATSPVSRHWLGCFAVLLPAFGLGWAWEWDRRSAPVQSCKCLAWEQMLPTRCGGGWWSSSARPPFAALLLLVAPSIGWTCLAHFGHTSLPLQRATAWMCCARWTRCSSTPSRSGGCTTRSGRHLPSSCPSAPWVSASWAAGRPAYAGGVRGKPAAVAPGLLTGVYAAVHAALLIASPLRWLPWLPPRRRAGRPADALARGGAACSHQQRRHDGGLVRLLARGLAHGRRAGSVLCSAGAYSTLAPLCNCNAACTPEECSADDFQRHASLLCAGTPSSPTSCATCQPRSATQVRFEAVHLDCFVSVHHPVPASGHGAAPHTALFCHCLALSCGACRMPIAASCLPPPPLFPTCSAQREPGCL